MKIFVCYFVSCLIFIVPIRAEEGVEKVSRLKMKTGIGTLTTDRNETITANIKASVQKNKGKWKGIEGKILGKFFPKGNEEIINIEENKHHELNRKKKKCESRPLVTEETKEGIQSYKSAMQQMKAEQKKYEETEESERRKNIEILAQDFRVDKLDENVNRNNFSCTKFRITTYTKQRDTQSGVVRLDSASIETDMTKLTAEIERALEIEKTFARNYAEKLGLESDFITHDLFGGGMLEKFKEAKKDNNFSLAEHANMAEELSKLEGYYPIFTYGKMYSITEDKQTEKAEDGSQDASRDLKKKGFGLAKGLFGNKNKDKAQEGPQPFLEFENELLKMALADYNDDELHPPFDCKEKK